MKKKCTNVWLPRVPKTGSTGILTACKHSRSFVQVTDSSTDISEQEFIEREYQQYKQYHSETFKQFPVYIYQNDIMSRSGKECQIIGGHGSALFTTEMHGWTKILSIRDPASRFRSLYRFRAIDTNHVVPVQEWTEYSSVLSWLNERQRRYNQLEFRDADDIATAFDHYIDVTMGHKVEGIIRALGHDLPNISEHTRYKWANRTDTRLSLLSRENQLLLDEQLTLLPIQMINNEEYQKDVELYEKFKQHASNIAYKYARL
jgi:hypothetical protein